MDGKRAAVLTALLIVILGGFFFLGRVTAPPDVSRSERRPLEKMPEFNMETVVSGTFMSKFEAYAADSFAFREMFRGIKAVSVFGLFLQTDKSGLYTGGSGDGKFERIDGDSAVQAAQKIEKVAETLTGANIYYSFVPDKSIYAGRKYPGFDPQEMKTLLGSLSGAGGLEFIDLTGLLTGADFYKTDLHWSQPRILGLAGEIAGAMGAAFGGDSGWREHSAGSFQGVFPGQLALPVKKTDELLYLSSDILEAAEVWFLDERTAELKPGAMYDPDALESEDSYSFFLGGPQPLIVINNRLAETERELFIFRDSFSSSLAPLLVPFYSRITLIDLRYLDSRMLPLLVDFPEGSDVLFLYSSQILNNSTTLLVR